MAEGYSLHIGVNHLDADHYGSRGLLKSCERDAFALHKIAWMRGFDSKRLSTEDSTRDRVISEIQHLSGKTKAGDFVWITYSGHGSQIPDLDSDEGDDLDETWCLHDAQLLDDEIYRLLCSFGEGVRICLLTDSCHNQTIYKGKFTEGERPMKALSTKQAMDAFERNKQFYAEISGRLKAEPLVVLKASLIVLSPCEDHDFAVPSELSLSEFTAWVKFALKGGDFKGNYHDLIEEVRIRVRDRIPQISFDGPNVEDFLNEVPFTIEP